MSRCYASEAAPRLTLHLEAHKGDKGVDGVTILSHLYSTFKFSCRRYITDYSLFLVINVQSLRFGLRFYVMICHDRQVMNNDSVYILLGQRVPVH